MTMHDFSLFICATVELPGLIFSCGDRNRGVIFPVLHVEIMSFKFFYHDEFGVAIYTLRTLHIWDPGLNSLDEVFALAKTSIVFYLTQTCSKKVEVFQNIFSLTLRMELISICHCCLS
jgi:hypothetical protein